jgi:serine/threonine-protein kinase PknG
MPEKVIEKCQRPGCNGIIVDGICEDCGRPPVGQRILKDAPTAPSTRTGTGTSSPSGLTYTGYSGTSGPSGTGSRRQASRTSRGSSTRRSALGGGLLTLPPEPSQDPLKSLMTNPEVPERKRYCPHCNAKVNHSKGFCPQCGHEYTFLPQLKAGDVIHEKYEIKGPIAFGGLGWIYLAWDTVLSRWVIIKGLLNAADEAAAAAAVSERQFLAAVKHPKIVGIYDFIQQGTEGFIIMEYVGGRTIQSIRKERGPLPVEEAISYILGILPAFTYLHEHGLVYCDFKPENVMLEEDDVKLIDMGGVRRINDPNGDIYGTRGYMAPEAADNPVEVSDLYTIGRSLATLIMDFQFMTDYEHSLPTPSEQPVLAENEALYRFLLRATHDDPDQRFQSAEEMGNQLYGVLREIVALKGDPKPAESSIFTYDNLIDAEDISGTRAPEERLLPALKMDTSDPAISELVRLAGITEPEKRVSMLSAVADKYGKQSAEARLLYTDALISNGDYKTANRILDTLAAEDEFNWKAAWYRGKLFLAAGNGQAARNEFDKVYFEMPGEIAPKLAIAFASEQAGDIPVATAFYQRVARTDPNNTTAVFGLARCLQASKDFDGAAAALDLVPVNHSLYTQSRIVLANVLLRDENVMDDKLLDQSARTIASISTESGMLYQLSARLLSYAVWMIAEGKIKSDSSRTLLGNAVNEHDLRLGAESAFRKAARFAGDSNMKIQLIDFANHIRPVTRV